MAEIIDYPNGRRRAEEMESASWLWWRKLDIPRFAVQTAAMDTETIGAFVLLQNHYHVHGGLPKSDAELAQICKFSKTKFVRRKSQLLAQFDADGRNPELDANIEEAKRISSSRREAGRKGGLSKSQAFARQEAEQSPTHQHQHQQPHSQLQQEQQPESSATKPSPPPSGPRAREAEEIKAEVLAPLSPNARAHPVWHGLSAWIAQLLTDGAERVEIVVGFAECMRSRNGQPPNSLKYFMAAIERAKELRTRSLPTSDAGYTMLEPGTPEWQAEYDRLLAAGAIAEAKLMTDRAAQGRAWQVSQ